jgi:hypothetical protein
MTADTQENPGEAQARRLESVYKQLAALLRGQVPGAVSLSKV